MKLKFILFVSSEKLILSADKLHTVLCLVLGCFWILVNSRVVALEYGLLKQGVLGHDKMILCLVNIR